MGKVNPINIFYRVRKEESESKKSIVKIENVLGNTSYLPLVALIF
jgi:hypothetical protein